MNPTQFDFATPPAVSLSVRAERAEAHKKQRGTDLDQPTERIQRSSAIHQERTGLTLRRGRSDWFKSGRFLLKEIAVI